VAELRPDRFPHWPATAPPLPPTPPRDTVTGDRLRGMILGLAVGDALGNTSEGQIPDDRRLAHGEIRDYLPNRHSANRRVGLPSDDTQMAAWTLESLLRAGTTGGGGCLDLDDLAATFASRPLFGMGRTVLRFLRAYGQQVRAKEPTTWWELGQPSAGNGALMRIAPICFPHLHGPSTALWRDVIDATALTHADEMAVVSSVGFVGLFFECLAWRAPKAPPGRWWVETFLRYAGPLETGVEYEPRVPTDDFRGSLSDFLSQRFTPALVDGWTARQVSDRWHSGAYLLETVPTALATLALHAASPEEAIVRAVNDAYDNDTVAAVVGAAVGALHGASALPPRWLDKTTLPGFTQADDEGRLYEILDQAIDRFWEGEPT
jgi:ADP-ribosyl-[dinitrogen reductase] hydrolase